MEKKLLNNHEYYELNCIQANEIFTKSPICDKCSIALVDDNNIVYVVALNMLMCKDCFNKWANNHKAYKDDEDLYRDNFINTVKAYEAFCKYVKVQLEGSYNMITEATNAAVAAGLGMDEYVYVHDNYKLLMKRFPMTRNRLEREELNKVLLNDTCEKFLKTYKEFEWFIIQYFGQLKLNELVTMAENKNPKLIGELDDIWFKLPDSRFNIIENPKGWSEFLNLIES